MTRLLIALACLSLTACGHDIRLTAAQGLFASEAGAHGLNQAAIVAAPTMTPDQKKARKAQLDTINRTVSAAHAAYLLGKTADTAASAGSALKAIADVQKDAQP